MEQNYQPYPNQNFLRVSVKCEVGFDENKDQVTFNGKSFQSITSVYIHSNIFLDQYQRVCGPRLLKPEQRAKEDDQIEQNALQDLQHKLLSRQILKLKNAQRLKSQKINTIDPELEILNRQQQMSILQDKLRCQICLDVMRDPVMVKMCLHRFCKKCFTAQTVQIAVEPPTQFQNTANRAVGNLELRQNQHSSNTNELQQIQQNSNMAENAQQIMAPPPVIQRTYKSRSHNANLSGSNFIRNCPMCKVKIGNKRLIVKDHVLSHMIAKLLGSNNPEDLSMVDAFNQTQSLIMDSYLRQNFNINEFAKEMKRKQEQQEVKIIEYIESVEKQKTMYKKKGAADNHYEDDLERYYEILEENDPNKPKRKYTRRKNLNNPENHFKRQFEEKLLERRIQQKIQEQNQLQQTVQKEPNLQFQNQKRQNTVTQRAQSTGQQQKHQQKFNLKNTQGQPKQQQGKRNNSNSRGKHMLKGSLTNALNYEMSYSDFDDSSSEVNTGKNVKQRKQMVPAGKKNLKRSRKQVGQSQEDDIDSYGSQSADDKNQKSDQDEEEEKTMDDVLLDKKNGLFHGIEDFFDTLDLQELKPTYTIELFLTHMNEYLNYQTCDGKVVPDFQNPLLARNYEYQNQFAISMPSSCITIPLRIKVGQIKQFILQKINKLGVFNNLELTTQNISIYCESSTLGQKLGRAALDIKNFYTLQEQAQMDQFSLLEVLLRQNQHDRLNLYRAKFSYLMLHDWQKLFPNEESKSLFMTTVKSDDEATNGSVYGLSKYEHCKMRFYFAVNPIGPLMQAPITAQF